MIGSDNDEDVPLRSPVSQATAVAPAAEQDAEDFSTLLDIQKDINEQMARLSSVDVFSLTDSELSIKEQIAAYKKAKEILEPIQQVINDTVENVKNKLKGRN